MLLLAPEVGEERGEVLRLRHDEGRPDERLELDGGDPQVVDRGEEVADVEDAQHVVERAAVDGVARERRVDDGSKRFLRRHLRGDRNDVGPRHHHLGHLLRGEVEDLVEHLLLGLLELTHVLRRADAVADVLARVREHPGRGRRHAQQPENGVRRHLQQPDDRVRDPAEQVERTGQHHGEAFRLLQRHGFRHELAEDDRDVREEREREEEADGARERRLHQVGDQGLADGADQDREDRDPELRRADEAHGLVHQAKRDARAPPALERALLEAGSACGDERVLRGHEHRAPEHEQEHDHDAENDAHGPRRAPILGGISSPIDQAAV